MRRIRYQDMPPERRAEFDRVRKFADLSPSPEERKFRRWVESGKLFLVLGTRGDVVTVSFGDKRMKIRRTVFTHVLPEYRWVRTARESRHDGRRRDQRARAGLRPARADRRRDPPEAVAGIRHPGRRDADAGAGPVLNDGGLLLIRSVDVGPPHEAPDIIDPKTWWATCTVEIDVPLR
jgi:hypothetical protein